MAKYFSPKNPAAAKSKTIHLSSHLVKPAKFASSKVKISAPRTSGKRSGGKIRI